MSNDCPTFLNPELLTKAEQLAGRYGQTHVVLSFGARQGGAYFAKWLRFMLMNRMAWQRVNNVYLDTECLKYADGTELKVVDASRPWLIGVASMNGGWKEYYRYAVHQSKCMIFVATPEWSASPYCAMERRYYIYENYERRRLGKPPLRAIELSMGGYKIGIPGARVIEAEKVNAETGYAERHVVTHRADHGAAARFGVKLKTANLPANENYRGNYTIAGYPLLQLYNGVRV